ncbi:hypothetical protein ABIC63_002898 [Pseudacidovorax sp. 1753]
MPRHTLPANTPRRHVDATPSPPVFVPVARTQAPAAPMAAPALHAAAPHAV